MAEATPMERLEALLEKRAPVQGFAHGIPWSMHLRAYAAYCKKWSPQPALIQGGCRGGFGTGELDMFIPGWRDQLGAIEHTKDLDDIRACLAEIAHLQDEVARKDAALENAYRAMNGVTVFVTSRERIKRPEGEDSWAADIAAVRAAASARGEGSGQ